MLSLTHACAKSTSAAFADEPGSGKAIRFPVRTPSLVTSSLIPMPRAITRLAALRVFHKFKFLLPDAMPAPNPIKLVPNAVSTKVDVATSSSVPPMRFASIIVFLAKESSAIAGAVLAIFIKTFCATPAYFNVVIAGSPNKVIGLIIAPAAPPANLAVKEPLSIYSSFSICSRTFCCLAAWSLGPRALEMCGQYFIGNSSKASGFIAFQPSGISSCSGLGAIESYKNLPVCNSRL